MAKYIGVFPMDDNGLKEQKIVAAKIEAKLRGKLGDGSFSSSVSVDKNNELRWAYVTNNDETPASETVVIDPAHIDDPATAEILEHADKTAKLAKKEGDEPEGIRLGSELEQDKLNRSHN